MRSLFRHFKPRAKTIAFALCAATVAGLVLRSPALSAETEIDPNIPNAAAADAVPAGTVTPAPLPTAPAAATSSAPVPGPAATAFGPIAAPQPTPTPVPLTVQPAAAMIPLGSNAPVRVNGVFGQLSASIADQQIAGIVVDQDSRTVRIFGRTLGRTTLTVSDQRGIADTVPVMVAPFAGTVAPGASIRITGAPAAPGFVAAMASEAAVAAAHPINGATVTADVRNIPPRVIEPDEIADIYVPVTVSGPSLFPVHGVTTVHVENVAQPPVRPTSLIVSDFPERLTSAGLLFTSTLKPDVPTRMMFYHYNPAGQPDRHIVLRAQNRGAEPATVQLIDGRGGPNGNEMLVGHTATRHFLVRSQANEGTLITVPGMSTFTLVDAPLPAGTIVNDMMQLRQLDGTPLDLTLTAEDRGASLDVDGAPLLTAREHHARGIYPIPQFFYETTYTVGADPLEIPVGQLPLPNLRSGEALVGDYGVELTIDAAISNPTSQPAAVALYANPRGGRTTGTFIIDRAVVQAHSLKSFSNYKLRQYVVPAHGLINIQVITMPEGGSSYPVNLVIAPDDGSVAPGAPGSPIY